MKKSRNLLVLLLAVSIFTSSCATVFGGHINSYQRTKPLPGQPQRRLRVAAFIVDIVLFWPGAIIDFATGAIYRPTPAPVDTQQPASNPVPAQSGSK
ncbi:hypothetical protein [Mucilaginibacter sp.]